MEEIWADIEDYVGSYQVSNLGNIRSLPRNGRKMKVLKLRVSSNGYFLVNLYSEGKGKTWQVHRLVAKAFVENPENKAQVNHINGNKLDNRQDNLEWNSPKENMQHATNTGLIKTKGDIQVFKDNILIDTLHNPQDTRNKGYDPRNVSAVLLGKRKTHKGCTFVRVSNEN